MFACSGSAQYLDYKSVDLLVSLRRLKYRNFNCEGRSHITTAGSRAVAFVFAWVCIIVATV